MKNEPTSLSGVISTARSGGSYVIGGCKRMRTTDTSVQTHFVADWQRRTVTSICVEGGGTTDLGVEYSYYTGSDKKKEKKMPGIL